MNILGLISQLIGIKTLRLTRLIAELNVVGYEIFNFIAELNVNE